MNEDIFDTTWKVGSELLMCLIKPFAWVYLRLSGVKVGVGAKFYGMPKVFKFRGTSIEIGERFENRSWWWSNPLGINHPTIFCTWGKGAKIRIGKDVGISGGSIVATRGVTIGDGTLIGVNCTIIDSDFHPIKSKKRRYEKKGIRSLPIKIGENVFIGMNCLILKGVNIPDNTVIPAGTVVRQRKKVKSS